MSEARRKSEKETARKVWSEVFQVEPKNTSELLKMLADLIDLVHDTKESLDRLNNIDHELYKKPFEKIERSLSRLNLDTQWKQSKDELDDSTLFGLEFCADQLGRASIYASVQTPNLGDLLDDLDQLTENVSDSDLPQDLKMLLIKNLEAIRRSILAYKIKGLEGIEYEIERGIGSLLLHKDEIFSSRASTESSDVWSSYFKVLERLHKVVALARETKELVGPTLNLLGLNGG